MRRTFVILALTLITIVQIGCRLTREQPIDVKTATPEPTAQPQHTPQKRGFIEFAGVSTSFDAKVFSVRGEEVLKDSPLEMESDKPGENFPKHRVLYLRYGDREATIRVLPIADYRRMYVVSEHYVKIFNENLDGIKKSSQDSHFRLSGSVLPHYEGEMPFIPFYDAQQEYQLKVEPFRFQNGSGFFFLTEYTIEPTIINNEQLSYVYQGISDDEKYYILGDFPVSVPFLPRDGRIEAFKDYGLPEEFWRSEHESKYRDYVRKTGERLAKWPDDKFEPGLRKIREIITALEIEN